MKCKNCGYETWNGNPFTISCICGDFCSEECMKEYHESNKDECVSAEEKK